MGGLQIMPPGLEAKARTGAAMVEWTGGILGSNLHRVYFAPGAQAQHERDSLVYATRPECAVSMMRLEMPGSVVPALEEGKCDANACGSSMAIALMSGKIPQGAEAEGPYRIE